MNRLLSCVGRFGGSQKSRIRASYVACIPSSMFEADMIALPSMYISVAQSLIKSIAIGRDPPEDANGSSDYTRDPVYVVCASHDATVNIIDLRDREQQYELIRSRSKRAPLGREIS